ncbi:hypothetical protein IEQ34_004307 [Dendrobium chrysotoxum]|uniref:Uncharacterized protein n=1 Tax=Dendrobium chrysotoxum TaxID=161865 RepID=A0AAV7GZW7_DENCH|nr:hypothetical protein IEQ34_004307 [Dendrobium chrysotoxum]
MLREKGIITFNFKLEDIPNILVNSEDFAEHFREWFIHISARRQMHVKFLRLVQGDKSVMQPLVPLGFKVYTILVERAGRVEINFQIT